VRLHAHAPPKVQIARRSGVAIRGFSRRRLFTDNRFGYVFC
jgi:hypothetical protein